VRLADGKAGARRGRRRFRQGQARGPAFYGEQIVPEALGFEAAAMASAAGLYALSAEELAG
jgi:hypothetical protein